MVYIDRREWKHSLFKLDWNPVIFFYKMAGISIILQIIHYKN